MYVVIGLEVKELITECNTYVVIGLRLTLVIVHKCNTYVVIGLEIKELITECNTYVVIGLRLTIVIVHKCNTYVVIGLRLKSSSQNVTRTW